MIKIYPHNDQKAPKKRLKRRYQMITRIGCVLCLFISLLLPLSANAAKVQNITLMTRNIYLGADLTPVLTAETPEDFFEAAEMVLEQLTATNYPERAWALAAEIVEKKPHLVGLQEVFNFTLNGSNYLPPFRDYLEDLMDALAAQGADYRVAAIVKNVDLSFPLAENMTVGVIDRDVILARSDVTTSIVPVALSGCRSSLDGCNYQVVANVTSAAGEISIERGFVVVDALIGNTLVRFVNTHLEEREVDPSNPLSPIIQAAQAVELISILAAFPNPDGAKVVIVGDINSSPQDQIIIVGSDMIVPPYMQFVLAEYVDTWTLRPGKPPGLTCCQAADLLNLESILEERIDIIFFGEFPGGKVKVNVVGNNEADKTPSGLWPSDHAGVVTRLKFTP
jgi:hypothetical protein